MHGSQSEEGEDVEGEAETRCAQDKEDVAQGEERQGHLLTMTISGRGEHPRP